MDRQRPLDRSDRSPTSRRDRRAGGTLEDNSYHANDRRPEPPVNRDRVGDARRGDRHRYDYYDYDYDRYRRYRGFRYCYTPFSGYYYESSYYNRSPYRWYYNPHYGYVGAFSFWYPYWFVPSVTLSYGSGYGSGAYSSGAYSSGGYGSGGYGSGGYEGSYGTGVGIGALDLDVSPEKAQIFVDGRLLGVADDYDGFPDFLWLEEGTYDVAIYHPGYETIFRQYTIYPGLTIDVEDRMRPGEAVPPDEHGPKTTERRDARIEQDRQRREEVEDARRIAPESDPSRGVEVGRLILDIWPPDAAVYLDGHFLGQATEVSQLSAGLLVEPGEHDLQVIHPDYPKRELKVGLGPGERQELAIVLER